MGTHPIFESDFDCLTESVSKTGMGVILRFWDTKKTPVLTLAEAIELAEERNCSEIRCNLLAIVANTEGPTKKGKAGFKRDVTLVDTSEDDEAVMGAINYWANSTDEECDWLAPSLKGGDLVCLLGVHVTVKQFSAGPFAKITYPGCDRRRPTLIWPAENSLSGIPLALKIPSATISGNHKDVVTLDRLLMKNKDFAKDVEEKVQKMAKRNEAKIKENREKFVVGLIEEVYSINKAPHLVRIRTKDLKTNQMRRLESTNSGDNFNEQEKYCDQIKSWLKSQKQRFDIEELKNDSGFTGAETFYIRLSEVARAAFPAVGGKVKPGAWLVLNRDELQTIEGSNIFEYDMRWDQASGAHYLTPFGSIGLLKKHSNYF